MPTINDRNAILFESPVVLQRNAYRHGWADGWRAAAKGVKE